MKKIALFGGTFDPIHFGHLNIAQTLVSQGIDEVWFVPVYQNPLKKDPPTSCHHRLNMARLACDLTDQFRVCDIECQRKKISYTIDTLRLIVPKHPNDQFFFVLGEDAAEKMPFWKEPDEIHSLVKVMIVKRELPISATEIRWRVKNKKNIDQLTPKKVVDYILENHLYL